MQLSARSQDTGAKTIQRLVELTQFYGYDGLQLVPHKTFADVSVVPNIHQAQNIGKALSDAHISILLIGAYFNPVHPDSGKVAVGIDTFKRYIDLAAALGGQVVGSESGSYKGDVWEYHPLNRTQQALDTVVDTFAELCQYAFASNIIVGLEGAAGHCLYSVEQLHRAYVMIKERTAQDNIKIIFDLYNMLDTDNADKHMHIAEKALMMFDNDIHCFHIKDCFYKSGIIKQVRPGAGEMRLKEWLNMIRQYNKESQLVLEGVVGDDIIPAVEFVREAWG